MDGTTLIKVLLVKKKTNACALSKQLKCTPANLYSKFKRNNFSLNELEEIANLLGCDLEVRFIDRESGKEI